MKKRLILAAAALALWSGTVNAGQVSGVVVTHNNKPVPFAYITVEGKNYATQADKDGRFTLNLPEGRFTLTASLLGYQRCQTVVTATTHRVEMYMAEDLINLNTVTVTGTRTPKTLANTPVVTRVITADDIRKLDATNIRDVLEAELPGLEFSYAMNQNLTLNMQGLGGMSLLFLIDGERLAGETLDNIDFQRLSVDNIERVEIVKGAATALYGSNAVGAVINIITKQSVKPWSAQVGTHFESRHNEQRHSAAVGFNSGRFTNMFNVQADALDSYTLRDKNSADSLVAYGSHQWNFKDKLTYRLNDRMSLVGRAGYYFHERDNSASQKDRARDFSGGLRWLAQLGNNDALDVAYNFDRYDKSDYYTATHKDYIDYKNVQNSLRALYSHTFDANLTVSAGGDAMTNYLKSYQFESDGDHKQFTADIFAQADWNLGKYWNIVAGLRGDYFSSYGWELTPKLAAMYHTGGWKLRGSYSKGFRAPTLKEMYMEFNMANIFYIYGNDRLESEISHSFTASAEYAHKNYSFTLTGYYNILNNEISVLWDESRLNGRGAMVYQNVGGTNLASVDASMTARYSCGLGLKLSYAYFHEFTRHDAPNTSDARPHSFTGQVDYRRTFKNYEFDVVLNGRYLSSAHYYSLNSDYVSYTPSSSAAYSMWKLTFLQRFYNALNVTVGMDNLFNYKPAHYAYNSPYTTGTTFTIGASIDIEEFVKLF